jgi:hypothetical protein
VSVRLKTRTALIVAIAVLIVAGIGGATYALSDNGGGSRTAAEDGTGGAGDPGSGVEPGNPGGGVEDPGTGGGGAGNACPVIDPDDPDSPVSSDCNDTPGMAPPGTPQVVEPTPGMAGVLPRTFDSATVGDDDRTVTIDFVSGIEPCYVLDHIDVAYGADAVTITMFEGHDASAGDVACIEIGVFKRVIVTLDQALAGRDLVDGAAR